MLYTAFNIFVSYITAFPGQVAHLLSQQRVCRVTNSTTLSANEGKALLPCIKVFDMTRREIEPATAAPETDLLHHRYVI